MLVPCEQRVSTSLVVSVLAARRLGEPELAANLLAGLTAHTERLAATPATIDYFATSLPALLLFDDDPQRRRDASVRVLRAQLALLAGDEATARDQLTAVLADDPGHELALDLSRQLTPERLRS